MKAVLLAAGEGKRMHPLTYTRPKVMLPVAGKPILEHLLLRFKKAGVEKFLFIIGYHREMVQNYFGDGKEWGISIDYVTQRRRAGTADALRMVEGLVDERFLVANGDVIIGTDDIARVAAKEENCMGLIEVEDAIDVGVVEVKGDKIERIHEKVEEPPTNLVNAGIYLFTPEIFSAISATPKSSRGEYELTDSLQLLIDSGVPILYQTIASWHNLSYPWDMLETNEKLMAQIEPDNLGVVEENAVLKGPISVGKGTLIRSGAYIVGPVLIGSGCDIGPNCYIRPTTVIGDNCHIGSAVEVKNSIIMTGSKIPHHNYIGDSIIGEDCNFGAGTKIANLRLDERPIEAMGTDTGRKKLGAIVGDRVRTGINSSLNVGCAIGNDSFIGPGAVAHGLILPHSQIF
jgi:bifunctional UDP-N-acetylglucosamine pyrophosphorylase/glucosamine-1-phosphate N-acetyltransferase